MLDNLGIYVSIPIFIISVISSTESEGFELLQNWFHGNTEYKSRSPSRSALLKSFVSTYIFDDFDDRPEEGFCWALIKIWSEEPMDGSESMVYEYGGLVKRRSSVWEWWSVLSGILFGNLLIVLGCERLQKPHTPILLGLCCQRKITSCYYEYWSIQGKVVYR